MDSMLRYRNMFIGGLSSGFLEVLTLYIPVSYFDSLGWIPVFDLAFLLTCGKTVLLVLVFTYADKLSNEYVAGYLTISFFILGLRIVEYLPPFESLMYLLGLVSGFILSSWRRIW